MARQSPAGERGSCGAGVAAGSCEELPGGVGGIVPGTPDASLKSLHAPPALGASGVKWRPSEDLMFMA